MFHAANRRTPAHGSAGGTEWPSGWLDAPYSAAWEKQLGYFLQHHTTNITLLADVSTNSVPSILWKK